MHASTTLPPSQGTGRWTHLPTCTDASAPGRDPDLNCGPDAGTEEPLLYPPRPFLSTSKSSLCLWPHPPLLYPPNFQEFFPNVNRSLAGPGRPWGDPTADPRAERGPRTDGVSWPRVLPLDSAQGSLSQEGFGDLSLTITRVSIPPPAR